MGCQVEIADKIVAHKAVENIETRDYAVSAKVDWIASDRSYPGEPRFTNIKSVASFAASGTWSPCWGPRVPKPWKRAKSGHLMLFRALEFIPG
jgi:hypothetical protein